MRILYLLFFFILISCVYADIDSVPDFKELDITKEESIDLCKLTNTDNNSLSFCLDKIKNNQNK